jgi:hypothetical protein
MTRSAPSGGMEFEFTAPVIEWRGPAPFYYAVVPEPESEAIGALARALTYGWGAIPVHAQVGRTRFTTSLFPKDGGYLLPLKVAVRSAEKVALGDRVAVRMSLTLRG